jgi:hypothetical protein
MLRYELQVFEFASRLEQVKRHQNGKTKRLTRFTPRPRPFIVLIGQPRLGRTFFSFLETTMYSEAARPLLVKYGIQFFFVISFRPGVSPFAHVSKSIWGKHVDNLKRESLKTFFGRGRSIETAWLQQIGIG